LLSTFTSLLLPVSFALTRVLAYGERRLRGLVEVNLGFPFHFSLVERGCLLWERLLERGDSSFDLGAFSFSGVVGREALWFSPPPFEQ